MDVPGMLLVQEGSGGRSLLDKETAGAPQQLLDEFHHYNYDNLHLHHHHGDAAAQQEQPCFVLSLGFLFPSTSELAASCKGPR